MSLAKAFIHQPLFPTFTWGIWWTPTRQSNWAYIHQFIGQSFHTSSHNGLIILIHLPITTGLFEQRSSRESAWSHTSHCLRHLDLFDRSSFVTHHSLLISEPLTKFYNHLTVLRRHGCSNTNSFHTSPVPSGCVSGPSGSSDLAASV